jgi:hypothetical protein
VDTISAGDPNIDYIEVQEGSRTSPDQYLNAYMLRRWNKPVWYEEYWYEMDGDQDAGIQNTHRNFIHAMAFPTMGSLMRNHSGINYPFPPDEAAKEKISLYDYLVLADTGILRMSCFADFYKAIVPDLDKFTPSGDLVNRGECGRFGNNFAVFLDDGGDFEIDLSGISGEYNVISLNIRTCEKITLPVITAGKRCTIKTGMGSDAALLLLQSETGRN